MQLDKDDIKSFQRLWKKSFGEDISEEKALDEATSELNCNGSLITPNNFISGKFHLPD